jgi:hypothetical protein
MSSSLKETFCSSTSTLYGSTDVFQLKQAISIQEMDFPVIIAGNSFTDCLGIKGPISIELNEGTTHPLYFYSNSFTTNSGFLNSNAGTIVKKAEKVTDIEDPVLCGSILIASNTFTKNGGCYKTETAGTLDI